MILNRRELREHSGPHFAHWRRRCVAALGATLPAEAGDDTEQEA